MSNIVEEIREILRNIIHPDLGKNIVEAGMVQNLKLDENNLSFCLTFQKSDDPNIIPIKKQCIENIEARFNKKINVRGNIIIKATDLLKEVPAVFPGVENIIAIASGKGGVGKSTIAVNLSIALQKLGYKVGLIDADIFGPSAPKMFNAEDARPELLKVGEKNLIQPHEKYGIKMLSIGFFVSPEQATVWRGPMASNAFKQMMEDGDWGALDYILVDLPPGTSDIHLTLVQTVPVTGVVIVSTPQKVALADAIKGIDMFESPQINVPVIGLVENMAWFTPAELPDNKYYIFGKDGCKKLAKKRKIKLLGQIPLVQTICESGDNGKPVVLEENSVLGNTFVNLAKNLIEVVNKRKMKFPVTEKVKMKR